MKLKILISLFLLIFGLFVYAQVSGGTEKFSPAKDFPKGALVYVQIADLPKLFELWNESELKKKHEKSVNFAEFKNRHLALKILERWSEFDDAFSMPFELEALQNIGETKSALAIYDIGKLEFVFISRMSEEKILASYFFQNQTGFEENELENGEVFYQKEIEVDRGRQKQKLLFMNFKGRLIMATNEALFFRTLAVLKGKSKDGSLADEFEFKTLAEKTETHLANVWVNQAKLNNDWYFRHYWLMNNFEELKEIRAGMFGFELRENQIIERRIFLKNSEKNPATISAENIASVRKIIPADVPFYKIESVKKDSTEELIRKTLLDSYAIPNFAEKRPTDFYFEERYKYYDENYTYLGEDFDTQIDDEEEAEIADENEQNTWRSSIEAKLLEEFHSVINRANPKATVYLVNPQGLENPLFLKVQKALIFSVQTKANLDKTVLEQAVGNLLKNRLTTANSAAGFEWKTVEKQGKTWREISTPFLDWNFSYALKDNQIIFANDADLLLRILKNAAENLEFENKKNLSELTAVNFSQREKVFDDVMQNLTKKKSSTEAEYDFFTNNIGSLLDVLNDLEKVEIRRFEANAFAEEELIYFQN